MNVRPDWFGLEALRGFRHAASMMLFSHAWFLVFGCLFGLALLLLMRLLLRKTWIAAGAWYLAFHAWASLAFAGNSFWMLWNLVFLAWWLLVFFRLGLLPLMVALSLFGFFWPIVPTLDPSCWYSPASYLALTVAFALAGYAFYVSLAGQPLFRDELKEV